MKIVVGINSLTSTVHPAYSNHIQVFFRLGKWAERNGHEICLVNPSRMAIDRMRNLCAKTALEINADYLLFIDDDVLAPTEFIDSLISADGDIVAGDVLIRGYPFNHMSFIGDKHGLAPIANLDDFMTESGIIDVGAVGFSLCLIKTSVLKHTAQPWFITGISNTEDIYFCLKAKEFIPELTIKLDTRVQCGHILWNEIISKENKEQYKVYMESMDEALRPKLKIHEKPVTQDRGDDYLERISDLFEEGHTDEA